MKNLTQEQWQKEVNKDPSARIIDVRTEEEFIEGYIPNAINLDIHQGQGFLDEIDKLDKEGSYYLYCRSGARSAQAGTIMKQRGFDKTFNLLGGITDWEGDIEKQ